MPIDSELKGLYGFVAAANLILLIAGLTQQKLTLAVTNFGLLVMTINAYLLQKKLVKTNEY